MKLKVLLSSLVMMLVISLLAGCGKESKEPVAINEETDKCATCNMQVDDGAYATQLITENGKVYKFDDIGCMNEWKSENSDEAVFIAFVRDNVTLDWVVFEDAYFAFDPSFETPMAYGIVTFKDKNDAQKFIDEKGVGKLMTSADLSSHTWERNKEKMKMKMKMGQGDNHEESSHMEG